MANGIQSTFHGNVTRDITLQRTQSGLAVANVDVAVAHRVKNGDRWDDGETTYIQCTVWRDLAEHCAESLRKGTPVVVTGVVFEEAWQGKSGQSGVQKKCDVEEIGVSLRFGTAGYRRAAGDGSRGGRSGGSGTPGGGGQSQGFSVAPSGGDVWAHNDDDPTPF